MTIYQRTVHQDPEFFSISQATAEEVTPSDPQINEVTQQFSNLQLNSVANINQNSQSQTQSI